MLKPCLLTNSPSNDYIRYPHFCFVLRELLWKFVKYSQTTITLDTPILRLSLQPRLSICIWSAHPGVCATHFHTNPPNEPDDLAYQHLKCTKPTIWSCISTSQVYQTNHIILYISISMLKCIKPTIFCITTSRTHNQTNRMDLRNSHRSISTWKHMLCSYCACTLWHLINLI